MRNRQVSSSPVSPRNGLLTWIGIEHVSHQSPTHPCSSGFDFQNLKCRRNRAIVLCRRPILDLLFCQSCLSRKAALLERTHEIYRLEILKKAKQEKWPVERMGRKVNEWLWRREAEFKALEDTILERGIAALAATDNQAS